MKSNHHDPEKVEKWLTFLQDLDSNIDLQAVSLMAKFHGVAHTLYQTREANLAKAGLSYARFRLLLNLLTTEHMEGRDELNPSEISDKQGISRNTVSALIRDLEKDGLIERHLDQEDRRRFNIRLTQEGRSLVRQYAGEHYHFIGHCFGDLSKEQQDTLGDLLEILETNIRRST